MDAGKKWHLFKPNSGLVFLVFIYWLKGKEQSFFFNNFILLNHKQICFITINDGCLT